MIWNGIEKLGSELIECKSWSNLDLCTWSSKKMAPAVNKRHILHLLLLYLIHWRRLQARRKHKVWVRSLLQQQQQLSQYHTLIPELQLRNKEYFYRSVNYTVLCWLEMRELQSALLEAKEQISSVWQGAKMFKPRFWLSVWARLDPSQ